MRRFRIASCELRILFLIILLALFLRFYHLGKVPPSPDWDEAALGYNAYSIMKTGRDEYGKLLPLILRSFDDYKPALYTYLVIPFIKIFGLNTFAVRLPSAILGTLTILLTYFLTKELFSNSPFSILYSLFTIFLLSLSPWHLHFSRIAFESNVGLFFNVLFALLFLKSLEKPSLFPLSVLSATLNIYVYQGEKIFTPLLFCLLCFLWHEEVFRMPKKYLVLAFIIGLVVILPFIYLALTTPQIFLRAKGTSFAADLTPFLARTVQKLIRDHQRNDYLGLILDNRRVTYFLTFIQNYLSHFDLNWLFIKGDDARHHAPGMGLLYLWELPFFLLGIYSLFFENFFWRTKVFLFGWWLLAPIPAAFTSGVPHAVRALNILPIPQILTALGLMKFFQYLKTKTSVICYLLFAFCFLFFVFNFFYYLNQYFVQLNYFTSWTWQYGYKEAIEEIQKIEPNFEKIVVSNQPPLDQSYMFFLFYLKYDPKEYQKAGGTVSGGFAEPHKGFGKYTFRPIKWEEEEKTPEILYVGRPEDFPSDVNVLKTIYYLDGKEAMKLVAGQ